MQKILIKCNTDSVCNFHDLKDFQGDLKIRTEKDIEKIKNSLKKHGFAFPFFVWKNNDTNYVLDGHGRLAALEVLEADGWEIPELPIIFVNCKSEKEAKDLLLRLNSQYGKMSKGSVLSFVNNDFSVLTEDFSLPIGRVDFIEEMKANGTLRIAPQVQAQQSIPCTNTQQSASNVHSVTIPCPVVNETPLIDEEYNMPSRTVEAEVTESTETNDSYTSYSYTEPIIEEKTQPPFYLFKLNDIKFETSVAEYQMFKNYMQQYAEVNKTTTGAINAIFQRNA